MADIFAANGYRTGHYGKWHLGDNYPYRPSDRGFQDSICCKSWGMYSAADYWNNDCFDDWFSHNGKNIQLPGYNTDVFFKEAMKWMKSSKAKDTPFFVYLPTTAVHAPLFVPDKYRQPYKDAGAEGKAKRRQLLRHDGQRGRKHGLSSTPSSRPRGCSTIRS